MLMIANLTSREVDVARELVKGKTNKEIARSLGLTPRTVKCYIGRMKNRLECGTSQLPRIVVAAHLMYAAQKYPLIAEALEL